MKINQCLWPFPYRSSFFPPLRRKRDKSVGNELKTSTYPFFVQRRSANSSEYIDKYSFISWKNKWVYFLKTLVEVMVCFPLTAHTGSNTRLLTLWSTRVYIMTKKSHPELHIIPPSERRVNNLSFGKVRRYLTTPLEDTSPKDIVAIPTVEQRNQTRKVVVIKW